MVLSFLESIKYSGLMWPIAFLRIYVGTHFLDSAIVRLKSGYLHNPYLNESLRKGLAFEQAPAWYQSVLENWVMQHWKLASYIDLSAHFIIGISLILGYMVRPTTLLGCLMTIQALWLSAGPDSQSSEYLLLILFLFFAVGAGRSIGVDYYFFKSRRGLWW
jgi:thiosulfate dehydrogenase [quinone] large subunit